MNTKHIGECVLSEEDIAKGVEVVAEKLNKNFARAVIISVVPGGILFTADLVRKLKFPVKIDYISCPHTPGDRNNLSDIVFHNNIPLTDEHVILIDDAIESGSTMMKIVDFLTQNYHFKSLSVATLFVKPGRININAQQFFAFEMANDDLLVGYGLPWQDEYRNIPYVSKLVI